MNKSFYIYNFGCKVNQEEGAALAAVLHSRGWRQEQRQAALYIINTCTVTQTADKKCRNLMRRLRREHPESLLAVCGCYAQRAAQTALELGADIVCGVEERSRLPELIEQYQAGSGPLLAVGDIAMARRFQPIGKQSSQSRARAYLKIEDGCDQFCNYCIVPHVRGPVRSLPLAEAVEQARRLLADGHAELVLSGIHIGAYGRDLEPGQSLSALIHELCALPGLLRLRLGSIEPQQFTAQLIETLAGEDKLCAHLHIPLQSGCDQTLAAMGRRYDSAAYARLLAELRQRLGDIAITTDVMAGYPGETEAQHQASRDFCAARGFAAMHVFPYSQRQGTPAATAPGQVAATEKARRAAELAAVAKAGAEAYLRRQVGRELTLLAEEAVTIAGETYLKGHSGNYCLLYLPQGQYQPGDIVPVRAVGSFEDGLLSASDREE